MQSECGWESIPELSSEQLEAGENEEPEKEQQTERERTRGSWKQIGMWIKKKEILFAHTSVRRNVTPLPLL